MSPEDLIPNNEPVTVPATQPDPHAANSWLAVVSGTAQEQGLTDTRAAAASWFGQFDRNNHRDAT